MNEVNEPPVLGAIGNKQVDEETALTFTATATDPDLPPNSLTFSLIGAPAGATINPTTGAFTWTPTEAQGPNSYTFKVRVTDNGTPAMHDEEEITVTVKEVNKAPVPDAIPDKTVDEHSLLSFTATATDPDIPANTFTWSIASGGVTGMAITSAGAFTWTPTEAQGPGVYNVTLRATDNGTPPLGGDVVVKITVNEVNEAPELAPIGNKNVNELVALGFAASATDPDLPANTLSYSLVGAPGGATINSSTGVFSWTPTEAQGPGSYTFTVKVTDNGTPALSDEEAITVTVAEVNVAPILASIGNKSVNWGDPLGFTAGATDADVPANTLTYELTGTVPAGATINGTTGLFSWTPTAGQVGSHTFNVRVYDNGSPVMADYEAITVTVGKRPTTLVYDGATTSQYSDQAVASATLKDTGLGTAIAGRTVGFTLGSQTGSGSTDASGKGIFTFTLNQAVGSYTMQSSFAGDAAYQQSSDSDGFTITTEDVIHSYSGFMLFNTPDISISTATLNLQATLRDPTAVSGDPKYDAFAGDVRTAQAKFVVRDADTDAFVGECNAGTPTPITPGDNKVATVSCNVPVNIGSEDDKEYKVITLVGPPDRAGNYQGGDAVGDFVMVAVVRPYPGSVSGGGYLVNPSLPPGGSAGTYAVDVGKKTNFGFSVRNNKSGKSMQGHVNIILRKGGKLYQIKTTSVTTFTPVTNGTGGTANFETKANLTDLTTGASTGNLTLKMVVIDKGEPGKDDTIEITLWNGGTLWYSSKWDGAKTVAALLTGGNLQVR